MERPIIRVTHTFALLYVSRAAFNEIRSKLAIAEYAKPDDPVLDMNGIALEVEPEPEPERESS